jgi:predicted RNA-binding protein associated with RNAse of E/G family
VDVIAWPDGQAEIRDEDELRERCERGYIIPELRARAMEAACRILSVTQANRGTAPDP